MRRGTILGGEYDGDILDNEGDRIYLYEMPPIGVSTTLTPLRMSDTFTAVAFDYQVDDDGRGWWVRQAP